MKVLSLLLFVVVAYCSIGSQEKALRFAIEVFCHNPSAAHQQFLQNSLNSYEKEDELKARGRLVLEGSIDCPLGELEEGRDRIMKRSQIEDSTSSDSMSSDSDSMSSYTESISLDCSTEPVDVQYGNATATCSYVIDFPDGIVLASVSASIVTNPGNNPVSVGTSFYDDGYVFFQTGGPLPTYVSGSFTVNFPQYAPNGTYTVSLFSYNSTFATFEVYNSTFVLSTVNENYSPQLTSLTLPAFVNTQTQKTATLSFTATSDLTGITEVIVYFYASGMGALLGTVYWENNNSPSTSVSATATITFQNGAGYGNYYPWISLYNTFNMGTFIHAPNSWGMIINGPNNCTAGTYLPAGAKGSCIQCPVGTYSNPASLSCSVCPPGTKPNGKGAATCPLCPAGYFSYGGTNGCAACPAGKITSSAGSGVCIPCVPGSFASSGASTCSICAAGTYSCAGATTCTNCPVGSHSSNSNASFCIQCPAGTFANTTGTTTCTPCPAGSYSAKPGLSSCTACASGLSCPSGSFNSLSCQ